MWHVRVRVGRDSKHVEVKFYGEISLLMLRVTDRENRSARAYKPRKLSDQISPLLTSMPPLCWCAAWCIIAADVYLSCVYLFIVSCSVEDTLLYYGRAGRWMLEKGCLAMTSCLAMPFSLVSRTHSRSLVPRYPPLLCVSFLSIFLSFCLLILLWLL